MFSPHSNYIAAGSSDSLIKVWDLKNNNQKNTYATIKSHVGSVSSLAWIRNTNQ
jgi:WD40 repeat protein